MTIEESKNYISLRVICGNIVISPIQVISEPRLEYPTTAIKYLHLQENGVPMCELDWIFIDSQNVRPLNEHCLKLGTGFYIVDSKQMALQSLYHLTKRRFCIGEGKAPFLQNLSLHSDRKYIKGYYHTYLNQLKRITL